MTKEDVIMALAALAFVGWVLWRLVMRLVYRRRLKTLQELGLDIEIWEKPIDLINVPSKLHTGEICDVTICGVYLFPQRPGRLIYIGLGEIKRLGPRPTLVP